MLAFRAFLDSLPKEEAKDCHLILKTEGVTEPGTDLLKVKEYIFDESYFENVHFIFNKLNEVQLNHL